VRLRSALSRRLSAPMVVSLVALFMSVGDVGYAAISLPANSVGTAQLKDGAVSYKKIVPNAVGAVRLADNGVTNSKIRNGAVSYKKIQARAVGRVRANLDQLQARLASTCGAGTAIGGVDSLGKVTCTPALPAQVGAADKTATVGATPAALTSISLPAGASYLVFANPSVSVTGSGAQRVTVTCALAVGGATQSRSVTVDTGTTTSIPLQLAGPAGTSSVSCSASVGSGTLPAVHATTAINALQTAG
jgi:hypothetical protein